MSTYPIRLLPEPLAQVLQAPISTDPEPFSLAPPLPPGPTPRPFDVRVLLAEGLGAMIGFVVAASWLPNPLYGVGLLLLAGIGIGYQVYQGYESLPERLRRHEKALKSYQREQQAYAQAQTSHRQIEELKQQPNSLDQIRALRIQQVLFSTQLPDGEDSEAQEGYSEPWFHQHLYRFFGDDIHLNLKVNCPGWDRHYTPDFTYWDPHRRLLIDIEIDEPYYFKTGKPTHCQGQDQARDRVFLDKGWPILRFTEEQVIRFPNSCCKVVAETVALLTGDHSLLDLCVGIEDLPEQEQWSWEEAHQMAQAQFRQTYGVLVPVELQPQAMGKHKQIKQQAKRDAEIHTFSPSSYQQRIFEFIQSGWGDGLVVAVAGSGKSTTLREAAKRLGPNQSGIYLAFNSRIAADIQKKLGSTMRTQTLNSLGFAAVRQALEPKEKKRGSKTQEEHRVQVVETKYKSLARSRAKSSRDAYYLSRLVDLTRQTLTDPKNPQGIEEMATHFGVFYRDEFLPLIPEILEEGKQLALSHRKIDFSDQIWLPVIWELPLKQYDWIFVDECQDLNACQRELVIRCRGKGGRLLFVGDPGQSIYGFAGADSESVEKIKNRLQPTVMPLSICYRCPSSHLDLARQFIPQIEARPGAPQGIVRSIKERDLISVLQEEDLILSRLTAPLIKLGLKLITKGITAQVQGKNLAGDLTRMVQEVAEQEEFSFPLFKQFLGRYERKSIERIQRNRNARGQIESLKDRVEGLRYAYQYSLSETVEEFCEELQAEFGASQEAGVILSTIHQAKGLEAERVFILGWKDLPLTWEDQQQWEAQQERNLMYVALTRAKQELYFVELAQ